MPHRLNIKIEDHHLLWFKSSNNYSCVDQAFFDQLSLYRQLKTKHSFIKTLTERNGLDRDQALEQYRTIDIYLKHCTVATSDARDVRSKTFIPITSVYTTKVYDVGKRYIKINFQTKDLLESFHPAFAHLETSQTTSIPLELSISRGAKTIIVSSHNRVLKEVSVTDYHKISGFLKLQFINQLHDTNDEDWLGLFHASCVHNNQKALMFIGESGSGKSTLSSLLAANDFQLLADDLTPINLKNQYLFTNPGAVSIKASGLDVINGDWSTKTSASEQSADPHKGQITHIPMHQNLKPEGFPCAAVIKVNYTPQGAAKLETIGLCDMVNTLIPDSWLPHKEQNAKGFMSWLTSVRFFQLTYSDIKEALPLLNALVD